jgi:flagellum-specific peptidoglycan hydrolase FlgJ
MNDTQRSFLDRAATEAQRVQHPFPAMAACEAALESGFGQSKLAIEGNNLFGMKQHVHPSFLSFNLPTREFENGEWVVVPGAEWVKYPTLGDCFSDRLYTLQRLSGKYPHYAAALAAPDPTTYVMEVSRSWSTDPNRATKVISIYQEYTKPAVMLDPPNVQQGPLPAVLPDDIEKV